MAFGSILTDAQDSAYARKGRGAFFTPAFLATDLCSELITNPRERVLEPACGEGAFLEAAGLRLRSLGAQSEEINAQLDGFELHAETIKAATIRLAEIGMRPTIKEGDFFLAEPTQAYDVVVGNPPYIRYQDFAGEQRLIAQKRASDQGVHLSSLASSWAPFLIHACAFLRPSGNIGMVLPAEIMSANYAAPVRAYLLTHFKSVDIHLFSRAVFPEVEEEVVLLIARGYEERGYVCPGIRVWQRDDLEGLGTPRNTFCAVAGESRWPLGEHGSQALTLLGEFAGASTLDVWGSLRLGAVTGANDYFCLSVEDIHRLELSRGDVLRLCPARSTHLRRLQFGEDDMGFLAKEGKRVLLFYPHDEPSAKARAYIAMGEQEGISERYKCRVRKPWWRVPGIRGCDLFVTYMNGIGPNICRNSLGLAYLNSVHGLTLHEDVRDIGRIVLPFAYLSTMSQLSAEVYGRSYGGGILKLEPREAAKTLVPNAETSERIQATVVLRYDKVDALLTQGKRDLATRVVDEVMIEAGIASAALIEEAGSLLSCLRDRRVAKSRARGKDGKVR